jgi:hypothetical protein
MRLGWLIISGRVILACMALGVIGKSRLSERTLKYTRLLRIELLRIEEPKSTPALVPNTSNLFDIMLLPSGVYVALSATTRSMFSLANI